MIKKRCIVIGNCQIRALERTLMFSEEFSKKYEFIKFPPVHKISESEVNKLHELLPSIDLIVSQPITENYRNNVGLGTRTLKNTLKKGKLITWPVMYWGAYNPELFYFKNKNGKTITEEFDYHHFLIFKAYIEKRSIIDVVESFFDENTNYIIESTSEVETKNLKHREKKLDIKVANYIEDNYRKSLLFFTFNHPSQMVVAVVSHQILKFLNIDFDLTNLKNMRSTLNKTIYPILPSVYKKMGLTFPVDKCFKIRNKEYTSMQVVQKYYSFYEKYQNLISFNQQNLLKTSKMGIFDFN